MNKFQSVVGAINGMSENEFTQRIVKPYFETLGYEWSQFNGGPYEKGVDLFAFKNHEVTDELMVVCVQSKVVKLEEQTKPKNELSHLITQLRQCLMNEQILPNGEKQRAREAYLAIAGELHPRLRDEIFGQLDYMGHKIVVLETPKLIDLLQKKAPHVLESLTQHPSEIAKRQDYLLGNVALNDALYSKSETNLTDIYSDLEFYIGKRKERAVIVDGFEELKRPFAIDERDFKWYERCRSILLEKTGSKLYEADLLALQKSYESELLLYNSSEVQKIIRDRDQAYKNLNQQISSLRQRASDALYSRSITATEQSIILKSIGSWERLQTDNPIAKELLLRLNAEQIVNQIVVAIDSIESLKPRIPEIPELNIELSVDFIDSELQTRSELYVTLLQDINSGRGDIAKVRNFLNVAKELLYIQEVILSPESPLFKVLDTEKLNKVRNKISFPPSLIFDSGRDIALFGGAGFGKTTTLQSYAAKCQEYGNTGCIFIELAKHKESFRMFLVQDKPVEESKDNSLNSVETSEKKTRSAIDSELLLKAILHSFKYEPDTTNVEELREFLKSAPLLLDGIDEIYGYVPTILRVIKGFKKENPKSQLIISSRDNTEYLAEIEFIGISLLPFTEDKLKHFVYSWLGDDRLAAKLWKKIESKDMLETVSNPLLATIACALTKEGVEVPRTGSELYIKRVELFTGLYDHHRGIKRTSTPPDFLQEVARQMAFLFHEREVRSLLYEEAVAAMRKALQPKYKNHKIKKAVDELINPCNILLMDEINRKVSFGHLRFQESLVAQVLSTKQRYELLSYLHNPFWRGAFTLLAESNAVEGIINECLRTEQYSDSYDETISAMISNSPVSKDKKTGYRELLEMLKTSYSSLLPDDY